MTLVPEIWGKTLKREGSVEYYPLVGHMLDSVTTAETLWDHWLRPGLKEFIERDFGKHARALVTFAAGIHDLGKCSAVFQGGLLNVRNGHSSQQEKLEALGFQFPDYTNSPNKASWRNANLHRHEKHGFFDLTRHDPYFEEVGEEPIGSFWFPLAVMGHHGDFTVGNFITGRSTTTLDEFKASNSSRWEQEQAELIHVVREAVGLTVDPRDYELSPQGLVILSGLIVLADRLASAEDQVNFSYDLWKRTNAPLEDSKRWVDERKDSYRNYVQSQIGFAPELTREDILRDYSPRGVQKVVPRDDGLWIAMAPTGSGKTEAALLRHEQRQERLMLLLPTLSTTNAMFRRLENIYGGKSGEVANLAHSLAFLEEFKSRENLKQGEDWESCGLTPVRFSKNAGANLAASINVGTIDQLVAGAFPIKWAHLRWLLIANSHVIIDEAHLLDHYQIALLKPILRFLGDTNTRVTVISATLPSWLEKELSLAYNPKLSWGDETSKFPSSAVVNASGRKRELSIETSPYEVEVNLKESKNLIESHVTWAAQALEAHPRARVGVFVNQIGRAQEIAKRLSNLIPDATVICLHSRMLAKHRKLVTEKLLELCGTKNGKAERVILVGTQVVEMSLDIDLDLMSTDLCPAPSLIQRMGRVWRDKSQGSRQGRLPEHYERMFVQVFTPVKNEQLDSGALLPYGESISRRTHDFLRCSLVNDCLKFPESLQSFVETSYLEADDAKNDDDFAEKSAEIFRSIRGNERSIDYEALFADRTQVQEFGSFTRGDSGTFDPDELATRIIEVQSEPFVLRSSDPHLQALGALDPSVKLSDASVRALQAATVGLSWRMAKDLEGSGAARVELGKYSFGFEGELPEGFIYDRLVGLMS